MPFIALGNLDSEREMYSEIMALVLDFILKSPLDPYESVPLHNPNHCVCLPSDNICMPILHALFLAKPSGEKTAGSCHFQ